jgi:hypothetical protein
MDISNRILQLHPASITDANPQRCVVKVFGVMVYDHLISRHYSIGFLPAVSSER